MKNLEFIGLEESKVSKVREALAQLLADFQIYYTNLRNLHWNVKDTASSLCTRSTKKCITVLLHT